MKSIFKRKLIIILLILAAIIWQGVIFAQSRDFPRASGFVNDFAGIVSPGEKTSLNLFIGELERKTSAEIAIVTLTDIGEATIEEYAVDLFENWGIGKKDKDNGLLILLVAGIRKVRIEVGYGLEGIITDGLAGEIIRQKMVPYFQKGEFGKGLYYATATISHLIARESGVELSSMESLSRQEYQMTGAGEARRRILANLLFLILIFAFFGMRFFFFPLFFLRGGYWGGGSGGFGGGMGGFGGFGGGLSGGGGASGSW